MYYILAILGFVIVIFAQFKINYSYSKYKAIENKTGLTGADIARKILDDNGLNNILVSKVSGDLTDHYDPKKKVVNLSTDIYSGKTIAAISVAAHEVGHAIQDKDGYSFMRIRSFLVPFVNLVSYLGYFGLFISIFAGLTGYIKVSIIVILATILFQLVTLPVEFNASSRAKKQLLKLNVVDKQELKGVNKMLSAAAFTYVASLISNLLQLLRLVLILKDND